MRGLVWLISVVCLLFPALCWASGEWEGVAEFGAVSEAAGLVEQYLDLSTTLAWELSLAGLDLEISRSFEELTSEVHAVSEAIAAIEKLKARKALKGKAELQAKLDAAKAALERGENARAVAQLRHFIAQVEELHIAGEFTTREANSLIVGTSEYPGAERIIRKIDKGKRASELALGLSATIAKLELSWSLQGKEAVFPAPGKDNRATTVNFAVDGDWGNLDLFLELEHQQVDFFQRWSREDSKLVDQIDLKAELDLGDLELAKSLGYETTFFPERIGEEVESARVAEVSQALERLKGGIASSNIPDKVKAELTKKIQSALDALEQGQRGKAVDHLEDFIDLVERRRREGKLGPADAEWLIAGVWEILPRERRSILSGILRAEFAIGKLDLEIEGTSTLKAFPAETEKDERAHALKLGFEAERGGLSLEGNVAWQRKLFPNDPAEDELIADWEGTATFGTEGFEATSSFEIKTTIYPNNSARDNTVLARSLKLEWALARADCTLSWEREATGYPNAPAKDKLVDEFRLVLEFAQPGFTIDLERKATTYPLAPAKDKLVWNAEFKLAKGIAPRLALELAASFAVESYPNQPVSDRVASELELAIEQKF
jgi:hypothetical protein